MKKWLLALLCIVCLFTLCACSSQGDYQYDLPNDTGVGKEDAVSSPIASQRKVYYTVDVSLKTTDVVKTANDVKALMVDGEWIASESQSTDWVTLTLRIKTERIDTFVNSIGDMGEQISFSKQSTDVTEQYLSNEQQIASLTAEKTALEKLYAQATDMSDILTINKRLSEVNGQLQSLANQQSKYDSLVDYSIVTIRLTTPHAVHEDTFGSRLLEGLSVGWDIAQSLIIFVICALPFAVVIGGIVMAIVFLCKRKKNRKNNSEK